MIAAGIVATFLIPQAKEEPDYTVDLPEIAEKYASGGGEVFAPLVAETGRLEFDPDLFPDEKKQSDLGPDEDPLPIVIRETPVKIGSEGADPVENTAEIGVVEDTLSDGRLRITIPGQDTDTGTASKAILPLSALIAEGPYGATPRIGDDGTTPFAAYRRPSSGNTSGSTIAIMVSGLGLDPRLTRNAIDVLPPEVSLSFAPYSSDIESLMMAAMAAGHEVAIEIPMEAPGISANALGPAGLMTDRGLEANAKRLGWLLARAPAFAMATNYLGATYSSDGPSSALLMATMKAHGLGYLDDTGLVASTAGDHGVPYGKTTIVLGRDSGDVTSSLDQLVQTARTNGQAVAKVYISAEAISAIQEWSSELETKGVTLVPASAMLQIP